MAETPKFPGVIIRGGASPAAAGNAAIATSAKLQRMEDRILWGRSPNLRKTAITCAFVAAQDTVRKKGIPPPPNMQP